MSKSKTKSSKGATAPENSVLNKVKDAAVTKPAQTPKAKSKEIAKQVAAKEEKKSKHKKVKEPTPEPESDSEESASSASDVASESESESEAEAPAKKTTTNGDASARAKVAQKDEASDADSDSSESSDDEPATSGVLGTASAVTEADQESDEDSDESEVAAAPAAVNGKSKPAAASSDESESSDSDEESDDEQPKTAKKALSAEQGTKKSTPVTPQKASDENSIDSEDEEDEDSEESSDSSDDEEIEPKRATSKRKAEEEATPAAKKAKAGADASGGQGKNLFVGSLSWNVDEQWLTSEFEEFGELTGVRIITDRDTGRSKGFGYVEFVNAADAAAAHAAKQGADLDGRKINVDFATSRTSGDQKDRTQSRAKAYGDQTSEPTDTLWIGNISFQVDQDQLSTAFQDYGTILGVRLPTDRETGALKGFGYVTYSSADEAKAAMDAMQGADLAGRSLRLDFSQPRPNNGDSPARGGRGRGRGGFSDRGRGGRGGARGGRGGTTNRGGFGDFSGKKTTF
ncbi:hypothetical protein EPUS_00867 [Endocarpon pusillum Z07020]|uniref:RRM domain-containing protein n=1 Tax=Endocarpon pusillum (strain Z07020 / HMAS-L-300199) TaxID=1263415 RepID=U1HW47_ENDPU|nr:uncharacterized protein EPUS_00867 [Endocarpon pusillum Z07020]ERF73614.1 hypothetical protein EPUS_00867 [Endocarpon pusillum Z07020]